MTDLMAEMERFPDAGETLFGHSFNVYQGGKGANQCIAIARLKGVVTMVGKVGKDAYGSAFVSLFEKEGIPARFFISESSPSGIGHIQIDKSSQNRICVIPGANRDFDADDFLEIKPLLEKAKYVLAQLEMNNEITFECLKYAKEHGATTILNPAPVDHIPEEHYRYIDYITPNETELGLLSSMPTNDLEEIAKAAASLIDKGFSHIVVTIGSKGALYVDREKKIFVSSYKVKAIDTVAAGDSFNGALVASLARGDDIEKALKFANAMGALTVTEKGAIPSLHTLAEVEAFMKENDIEVRLID